MTTIDWNTIGVYFKGVPIAQKIRSIKFLHDSLPTVNTLHCIDKRGRNSMCGAPEISHNLFRCPILHARHTTALRSFELILEKEERNYALSETLIVMVTKGYEEEYRPQVQ